MSDLEDWARAQLSKTNGVPAIDILNLCKENADLRKAVPFVNEAGNHTWPSVHDNPTVLREMYFAASADVERLEGENAALREALHLAWDEAWESDYQYAKPEVAKRIGSLLEGGR